MDKKPHSKKVYIFDIETNNLYLKVDKFHCAYIFDVETESKWGFRPHEFELFVRKLESADVVVGHNVLDYDLPTIKKFFPTLKSLEVVDTLCLSRYLEPDMLGGHSLKAWGERLGDSKGTYSEDNEVAWDSFNEDMFEYCEQDVSLTLKLYKRLCKEAGFNELDPPTINWTDV